MQALSDQLADALSNQLTRTRRSTFANLADARFFHWFVLRSINARPISERRSALALPGGGAATFHLAAILIGFRAQSHFGRTSFLSALQKQKALRLVYRGQRGTGLSIAWPHPDLIQERDGSGCGTTGTSASHVELGQVKLMKYIYALLAAAVLLTGAGTSHAAVRIGNDRGGLIADYLDGYEGLRASRQTVVIDGLCASACTIVLGAVPHDRICVTPNAALGFHAAFDFVGGGRTVTNPEATELLYAQYPPQVRRWIASRGGLTPHMMFLRGRQLEAMYRPCGMDAELATGRGESRHALPRSQRGLGAAFMHARP